MKNLIQFIILHKVKIGRCLFMVSLLLNIVLIGWEGIRIEKNYIEKYDYRKFKSSGDVNVYGHHVTADKVVTERYTFKKYGDVLKFRNSIMLSSLILSDIIYNCDDSRYEIFVVSFLNKEIK